MIEKTMNHGTLVFIIKIITVVFMLIWGAYERISAIRKGKKHAGSADSDRKSLTYLYGAIISGYCIGIPVSFSGFGEISTSVIYVPLCGLLFIIIGLVIRMAAIKTLAGQFTYTVKIVDDHKLITSGIYKYIRHPSYLGQAFILLGCGLALSDWVSVIILFVPVVIATIYRINIEEVVLSENFPDQYKDYIIHTKKLIPWIY